MPQSTTIPLHPELAAEIARTGQSLTQVSHLDYCNSQYLLQIIRVNAEPSAAHKGRIARVLGRPIDELFAEGAS